MLKGEIISVRFTDEKYSTIEVICMRGERRVPYYCAARDGDPTYEHLKSIGLDRETIIDATAEWKKASSREFNKFIKSKMKNIERRIFKKLGETKVSIEKSTILEAIHNNNDDEDALFKMKITIFDLKDVKAIKDRAGKLKIRKAKTLLEAISAYYELLNKEE